MIRIRYNATKTDPLLQSIQNLINIMSTSINARYESILFKRNFTIFHNVFNLIQLLLFQHTILMMYFDDSNNINLNTEKYNV